MDLAASKPPQGTPPTASKPETTGPRRTEGAGVAAPRGAPTVPFRALIGMSVKGRGQVGVEGGPRVVPSPCGKGALDERTSEGASAQARSTKPVVARDREGEALGDDKPAKTARAPASETELLDPSMRQLAQLAPPATTTAGAVREVTHESVMRARSLEELLPALVRRIAWAGDRHRATVRLELGAGAYEGTTLVVHADGGKVRVEAFGGSGDLDRLRARLDARLRGHGLDVDSVT